jgi:hypothetical protein
MQLYSGLCPSADSGGDTNTNTGWIVGHSNNPILIVNLNWPINEDLSFYARKKSYDFFHYKIMLTSRIYFLDFFNVRLVP